MKKSSDVEIMQNEVTPTEARAATLRPRAMIWVLLGSLFLCAMAALGLAAGWISLPLASH